MVKIKDKRSIVLISKEYEGPIEELPFAEYINDLKKWAKSKKAKPFGKPVAFYYHDFDKASDENFRADIGQPIKRLKKADQGYKLKYLPRMQRAVMKFKGTPSDYPEAYEEIYEYIEEKGYKPYGERMEKFKKTPKEKGGKYKIKSELQIPVQIPSKPR